MWDKKIGKITKKKIRKKTGGIDVGETIIKLKWRCGGHIVRDKKNKWRINILNWRPFGKTRKRGRRATRWRDDTVKIKKGTIWLRAT